MQRHESNRLGLSCLRDEGDPVVESDDSGLLGSAGPIIGNRPHIGGRHLWFGCQEQATGTELTQGEANRVDLADRTHIDDDEIIGGMQRRRIGDRGFVHRRVGGFPGIIGRANRFEIADLHMDPILCVISTDETGEDDAELPPGLDQVMVGRGLGSVPEIEQPGAHMTDSSADLTTALRFDTSDDVAHASPQPDRHRSKFHMFELRTDGRGDLRLISRLLRILGQQCGESLLHSQIHASPDVQPDFNDSASWDGVKYPRRAGRLGGDPMDEDVEILDNVTRCPGCNSRQAHEILKQKTLKADKGVDYLLRCERCGKVHTVIFRSPRPVTARFTLSDGPDSVSYEIEVDGDEIFTVGDEFEAEDRLWSITRLEIRGNQKKPTRLAADEVHMVWATRIDLARIKRTFSDAEVSFSDMIEVSPNKVFSCGTIVKHRGQTWRIRALHSGESRTLTGKMIARDIRRIFLHLPPTNEELNTKSKIERGKWKGQEFPGREDYQRNWQQN